MGSKYCIRWQQFLDAITLEMAIVYYSAHKGTTYYVYTVGSTPSTALLQVYFYPCCLDSHRITAPITYNMGYGML